MARVGDTFIIALHCCRQVNRRLRSGSLGVIQIKRTKFLPVSALYSKNLRFLAYIAQCM
jgi:hypothetical protein